MIIIFKPSSPYGQHSVTIEGEDHLSISEVVELLLSGMVAYGYSPLGVAEGFVESGEQYLVSGAGQLHHRRREEGTGDNVKPDE